MNIEQTGTTGKTLNETTSSGPLRSTIRPLHIYALVLPLLAALVVHSIMSSRHMDESASSTSPSGKRRKTEHSENTTTRIGIVGYGSLGRYLSDFIVSDEGKAAGLELAFVWNRSPEKVRESSREEVRSALLENLQDFASRGPVDIIVEVAHPSITGLHAASFLDGGSDYFCGSPTCFADQEVESAVRSAVSRTGRSLYLPAGALWGSSDIQKMSARGSLKGLTITMKKAPHHLKLLGGLRNKLDDLIAKNVSGEHVLYEGPVRALCPLAPNNVNTMACAAMAAGPELGFDGTQARLVVDKDLTAHIVQVDVEGPNGFTVGSTRFNPAKKGAVTGNATYASFLSSLLAAVKISGANGGVQIV